jgi:2-amino-4-hydroxy-6-hydroxymethyldihydropteridine diphosphokinase
MTLCYLGLGSNLRSPERQLRRAIILLKRLPKSTVVAISNIYFSRPYGVHSQPPYCNMVIALNTSLPAHSLLRFCQRIENIQQRVRKKRWGARTLDIDVLLYGKQMINHPNLIVPHPEMVKRDFVLVPLLEISPNAQLPNEASLVSYLKHCETYLHDLQSNLS